jgi:hypothetical protein
MEFSKRRTRNLKNTVFSLIRYKIKRGGIELKKSTIFGIKVVIIREIKGFYIKV